MLHRYRGRGYALESARSCVGFAVGKLRAPTVCSIVDPENESWIRVADAIHDCMRTFVNSDGNEWNLYWTDRPSTTDED